VSALLLQHAPVARLLLLQQLALQVARRLIGERHGSLGLQRVGFALASLLLLQVQALVGGAQCQARAAHGALQRGALRGRQGAAVTVVVDLHATRLRGGRRRRRLRLFRGEGRGRVAQAGLRHDLGRTQQLGELLEGHQAVVLAVGEVHQPGRGEEKQQKSAAADHR